jgi:mannose/cellobiose epimerase-like protein (N-acyl-D-glucosamine 2-epimerase family)
MNNGNIATIPDSLRLLQEIIVKTMQRLIERTLADPSYGWIDMKFDALTGNDTAHTPGVRDRNHVYSWIQGRGLEAITTHMKWFQRFPQRELVDESALLALGKNLSSRLQHIQPTLGGHFPFLLDSSGKGPFREDNIFTMSDLFCARGMYAYCAECGTPDDLKTARVFLKQVVQAILNRNFINDQVSFDPSQYNESTVGRTSYAGHMLALGAVTLLMRTEHDVDAIQQGKDLITHIVDHHINLGSHWPTLKEYTVVEWVDVKGDPYRKEGVIVLDPGHALEFVGLTAQMLQTWKQHYTLEKADEIWIDEKVRLLFAVLKTNLKHGYHSPGGILKSVDGETGRPVHDSMPWWALPETLRALMLVHALSPSTEVKEWTHKWFCIGLNDFDRNYFRISKSGVAVQTINTAGLPVAVIPATPDLDPGYHTGLSLIDCHTVLAQMAPLVLGKAEIDISVHHGVRLSGHVARTELAYQILDPLHVRVCILESPYNKLALVSADVLEFPTDWAGKLQMEIAQIVGIEKSGVLLTATHTHTAPPMIDLGTLPADLDYQEYVHNAIIKGCEQAMAQKIPIRLFTCSSTADIGINRRFYSEERKCFEMKPNPQGSRDDGLGIVVCKDFDGLVQALWFNIAVHPTTLGVGIHAQSADYPGRVNTALKTQLGNQALIIPLIGACGDVRPAVLSADSTGFREGTEADIEQLGIRVAQQILNALPSSQEVMATDEGIQLNHALQTVQFPLRELPSREQLEYILANIDEELRKAAQETEALDEFTKTHDNPLWSLSAQKVWAERLLTQQWPLKSYVSGDLMVASLGDSVLLCSVPGELFSSVGLRIKALAGNKMALLVGYSGGSLGYFPSKEAAIQGGYETSEAFKYYGVAGPFSEDTEEMIIHVFHQLMQRVLH